MAGAGRVDPFAVDDDDEDAAEQANIMEACRLLAEARNLTRANRERGIGGEDGIDEHVTQS